MKKSLISSLILAATISAAPVLTWVSPYAIYADKSKLTNNPGITSKLTHIGLQLWNPVAGGGLTYAPLGSSGVKPSDADITSWVTFAHGKGIKTWLTIYNNSEVSPGWNWSLVSGIITNTTARAALVSALVAEVNKFNLDGVDLDLEGTVTTSAAEKTGYLNLVRELKIALPAGKEVNVDSFHWQWNAPNWDWWGALITNGADYITSMGYEDLGANPTCSGGGTWCSYASQTAKIGATYKNKLILGVPGHLDTWQNGSITSNLQGVIAQNGPGVGIWEIYNMTASWLAGPTELSTIKAIGGGSVSSSSVITSSSSVISSIAVSSSATSSSSVGSDCVTYKAGTYWNGSAYVFPAKVTEDGTSAWSCVAGKEAFCADYAPSNNAWSQWSSAGTCALSSSSVLSSSSATSSVGVSSSALSSSAVSSSATNGANLVTMSNLNFGKDAYGSAWTIIDTVGYKAKGAVTGAYSLVESIDDVDNTKDKWAWMTMEFSTSVTDFSAATGFTVNYSADYDVNLQLIENPAKAGGTHFAYMLPKGQNTSVTIPWASFKQPSWVTPKGTLDKANIEVLSFGPTGMAAQVGKFTISGIYAAGMTVSSSSVSSSAVSSSAVSSSAVSSVAVSSSAVSSSGISSVVLSSSAVSSSAISSVAVSSSAVSSSAVVSSSSVNANNLVLKSGLNFGMDTYGSTWTKIDTVGYQTTGVVAGSYNLVESIDDVDNTKDKWAWMTMEFTSPVNNFSANTGVKVEYSADYDINLQLIEKTAKAGGTHFAYVLKAGTNTSVVIPWASFKQPSWVSPKGTLDLSGIQVFSFGPTGMAAQTGKFTISGIYAEGGASSAVSSSSVSSSSSSVAVSSSSTISSSSITTAILGANHFALVAVNGTDLSVEAQGLVQTRLLNMDGSQVFANSSQINGAGVVKMGKQEAGIYILEIKNGAQVQRIQMVIK